jgi:uncharacterized membrane protein
LPFTPAGNPLKVAPVAPVVVYVIFVIAVLIHFVCPSVPPAELNKTVLSGVTVIIIPLDVTGLPVAQDSDEVISTVITFPLDRVVVV